ncbi:MAG: potassium-transporting ATPase subunit C [Candidatus Bathyarchaeia archaeon]|jgi:K+-transporting ATPase ATPase C chain
MSKNKSEYGATIRLAFVSLVLCGLIFPLLVTGVAQVLLPYQANGDIVRFHGRNVGSSLIAQDFESPMFFHSRNATLSASGVDPDITLQDAYSQIPRIQNATGISSDALKQLVDQNIERTMWVAGDPYVNVLNLNLLLIEKYPSIYASFS